MSERRAGGREIVAERRERGREIVAERRAGRTAER